MSEPETGDGMEHVGVCEAHDCAAATETGLPAQGLDPPIGFSQFGSTWFIAPRWGPRTRIRERSRVRTPAPTMGMKPAPYWQPKLTSSVVTFAPTQLLSSYTQERAGPM